MLHRLLANRFTSAAYFAVRHVLMSRAWPARGKVAAMTASALVYALVLALFVRRPDYQLFIISVVPVLTAAWLFGFTGTVASTFSITLIHVMMVLSKGQSPTDWAFAGGGLGTVTTFLIGTLVSRISVLRTRLDRERSILTRTQDVTIFALAYEAELRDQPTGKHLERVSAYVRILADQLARSPQYTGYMTEAYVSDLARAAPLHDIGKVGVPDAILLKPGKLTETEFRIMQEHCELGAQVLRRADEKLQFESFLRIAIQIAMSHHEKWDGSGYPMRLAGEMIPLSARIMALADVYDALRSERSYKVAFDHDRSVRIIEADRGTHFDPDVADAFQLRHGDFRAVSASLLDTV